MYILTLRQVLQECPTPPTYKTRTGPRRPPRRCCLPSRPCASDRPGH